MVFKCQSDSFLKEFASKVVSCNKVQPDEKSIEEYEVILEDTILFPEGGGQPTDHGYLNDVPITKVIRKEDKAIHISAQPFNVGELVNQKIDWDRRFDHMQQHSGQHLISAILEQDLKLNTVSWWLGEDVSYIELDTQSISQAQIKEAESKINALIREARNVTVEIYPDNTSQEELKQFTRKGLPEDHKGDIRLINIKGIDRNLCCGTHVSNLSQLQMIKLLHSEKSKRKDKTLLYFLCGNRVLKRISACLERENKLTLLLKNNPSDHADLVEKLQKNVKLLNKNLQGVLKDVAQFEAAKLKNMSPRPKYYSLHKKEAEPDFMNTFIRELGDNKDSLLFLSTGDEKQVGNIVLYGPENFIADLGPKICELLEGKGAGKGNKFQAKVTKMANRKKAEEVIQDYLKNLIL